MRQTAFPQNGLRAAMQWIAYGCRHSFTGTHSVALVSLLTGKRVSHELAMTGEITLRGKILPVGGIKEKVLAARRAGIATVLLPKQNDKDLLDIPEPLRNSVRTVLVERVDDVWEHVFLDGLPDAGSDEAH